MTDGLVSFLREPAIHAELEMQGRIFIQNVLVKLNVLQRFFISAAGYDTTLRESMPEIIDGLIDQIRSLLETPEVGERILNRAGDFFSDFAARSGNLSAREVLSLKDEQKDRLDAFLCDKLLKLVDSQIDNVLSMINVRTLVSDRINALDMLSVERIVLDVMAGELKWINIFGGILGGLIGLFQAALSRLLA
jgi:hypothetical protein